LPRILVADDNSNIQKMVSLAFQDRGVEVTSVGNGEAAVRRLPDLNPDLILADIFMPVRNGYELCEWVKKDSKYSHIPVILLVGAFDPLDEKEARRVGADGVLKKPFIPPDPLIAMVISTLEKNPKLAAELAQAREPREAKIAAPPSAPVVAPEIPKKIALQPVRDVPESSTDDASLAYGFGAGRRGLENDGPEESAAARAPKSDFDKQTEEEFDGASTAKDWRRSAMAFEVPEEASRMAAFSEEESEPVASQNGEAANRGSAPPVIEFHRTEAQPEIEASVIEVEPVVQDDAVQNVAQNIAQNAVREVAEDLPQEVVQDEPGVELEHAVSAEQLQSFQSAAQAGEVSADANSEWASDEPDVPAASTPVALAIEIASEQAEALPSAVAKEEDSSPLIEKESAHTPASQPEASSAPKASHWMDLMGSVSDQPQSDWLSLINAQSKTQPANEAQASPLPQKTEEKSVVHCESVAHTDHVIAEQAPERAPEQKSPKLSSSADSVPALQSLETPNSEVSNSEAPASEDEDWFFADEPAAAAEAVPESIHGKAHLSDLVSQAADSHANHAHEFEATVAEPVAVNSLHEDTEFVEEMSAEPVAASEPELIQPPAVHVTPEPLLHDESSLKPSAAYGHTDQEIAPAHEFLPEVESKGGENSSSPEDSDAPVTEESAEGTPVFVRPPTREQLAHIPFLNPPPHLDHEAEPVKSDSHAAELQAVDTVVQRILDKIEPQLHDLLAQNLKPLIENLVHTELKKER
jgi:CheY-like chemotaxis protein